MGDELLPFFPEINRLFVAVSTGGACKGLFMRTKQEKPEIKVHAVDVEGSIIFTNQPKSRKFSGLGSSMRPEHLNGLQVDALSIVTEDEIVVGCHELLSQFALFCRASSGAIMAAVMKEIEDKNLRNEGILCILADSGLTYMNSVFQPPLPLPKITT